MSLLKVNNLEVSFFTDAGEVKAVRGISFSLEKGKTLGLVGESGCGKTATALSLVRLVPYPGRIKGGEILYKGSDVLKLNEIEMRKIRGKEIAFVFQEPMSALNPVFTIGEQIAEAVMLHQGVDSKEALTKTADVLGRVGIAQTLRRMKDYPHQLSGGMRQRVLIAMALACNPALLIADEPTTALDVTIQAQIIELIGNLQKEMQMAMLLITHDLGIVAETVDEVAIMYSGKIVEIASCKELFLKPFHPYTQGLLDSLPRIEGSQRIPLKTIKGTVGQLINIPQGCSFYDRCPQAKDSCREQEPELIECRPGHRVACYLYDQD
ncbi:MAG: ABC transporter ATP-binding protein [Candidatus Omnitrophota bacterium]